MIRSLVLLSLVAFAAGNNLWESGFQGKFGILNGFNSFPLTVEKAKTAVWQEVTDPPKYSNGFDALRLFINPKDIMIGVYYDENELAAGVLFCLPQSKVTAYYDMDEQGFTAWTYTSNDVTVEYWTIALFTVSEDAETRTAANDKSEILRDDYVTVQGYYGSMDKVATNLTNIDSIWIEQACFMWMGQHYYYNMTTSLSCDKPFYPWFPLYDNCTKQLLGMGLMALGSTTCDLENPTRTVVSTIVPKAPECLLDLVDSVGAMTYHVYFIDHPRLIVCSSC